jgi:hypothetical protein
VGQQRGQAAVRVALPDRFSDRRILNAGTCLTAANEVPARWLQHAEHPDRRGFPQRPARHLEQRQIGGSASVLLSIPGHSP